MKNKTGQVWIETVLYTLIGLALIGLTLTFIMPKINEAKDRSLIEQTITSLNLFDERISIVLDGGPGNVRFLDFTMKRGEFYIDGEKDEIRFVINDVKKPYTEPEKDVNVSGRVSARTDKMQKGYNITLNIPYKALADIKYNENDDNEKITAAPTSYRFEISNNGIPAGSPPEQKTIINILSTR